MSSSVTSVEIEDMLSSIRRLISEDGSGKQKSTSRSPDLLLTPALRVMDDEPFSEGSAASRPEVLRLNAEAERIQDDTDDEPDVQHAGEDDDGMPFTSARSTLEARIAELEEAVSRSRDEWEPDGSEPDEDEMPDHHIFSHPAAMAVTGSQEQEDVAVHFGLAAARLRAQELGIVPDPASLPSSSEANRDAEALWDEEALRDLVAEVVRQELQGALGERITRNVRRMVRREIQQALTLKDFN